MSGDFADSNVVLYMFDSVNVAKRQTAERIIAQGLDRDDLSISYQVVQEVLNVILRSSITDRQQTFGFLDSVLIPLCHVMPSQELYEHAIEIRYRYRYTFYDSLIIAAAITADCDRLLSEDLQPGQRIGDLVIVNPFIALN